jgi:hypothetical protein
MVPPVEGPLLTLESGAQRVTHLRHENVDIRPSEINQAMDGLFASPRIALNDTRKHMSRAAHRTGVAGKGTVENGRRVAFEVDSEICDYGGQVYDDRIRISIAAPLLNNDYVWWNGLTMTRSKIVDGSHPNSSHGRYANDNRHKNNAEIKWCTRKKRAVVVAIQVIYEDDEIYVAYDNVYWTTWNGDENIKREMVAYYTELEEEKKRVKAREKMIRENRAQAKARRENANSRDVSGVIPEGPVSSGSSSRVVIRGTRVAIESSVTGGRAATVAGRSDTVVDTSEEAIGQSADARSGGQKVVRSNWYNRVPGGITIAGNKRLAAAVDISRRGKMGTTRVSKSGGGDHTRE